LKNELKERENQEDSYIAKIEELNHTNLELEKLIREKDAIIRDKEQLTLEKVGNSGG
jgi:hypothetical protein